MTVVFWVVLANLVVAVMLTYRPAHSVVDWYWCGLLVGCGCVIVDRST
jgi:hypothetical protein